jgi:hypothetical protein
MSWAASSDPYSWIPVLPQKDAMTSNDEERARTREELCRLLHDTNTGRITPDDADPTRYGDMAEAVMEWAAGSRAPLNLAALPPTSRVVEVAAFLPTGGGGGRILRYDVAEDGTLTEQHFCRPPQAAPDSAEQWVCGHCGTEFGLAVDAEYVGRDW